MKQHIILDTGPLVALLNPQDTYHEWAATQLADIQPPLLTCEAVVTEACFLATNYGKQAHVILELMQNGFMAVSFQLHDEVESIARLMKKYADLPMSLADACLVRMSEYFPQSVIFTLDSDFRIYRKHDRESIPCLIP
jgi:predicted nucleic acid-binding protein